MPVVSGRALALVILAWSLIKVVAKLLFTKQPPGLMVFHDNYGSEGLSAIEPAERDDLEQFSRCIACGRCDHGEAERIATSRGEYPGLMQLVLASTRSMPDYDAAARGFAHIPEETLGEKTQICPVRIPFRRLAEFVRAKAGVA
jgi:succinate dehydrogenase/fumarate reductase-like Fe-S protein